MKLSVRPTPHVTVTYAQSIDGRIATTKGESRWISGPETLELAHQLRGEHETILVGIGTVLKDDPELTCRLPGSTSPVRVVLDSRLRLPADSRVGATATRHETIVVTTDQADGGRRRVLEEAGLRIESVAADRLGRPSIAAAVRRLADLGYRSVLVEGGGSVVTGFLASRIVGRLVVVTAPLIIGCGIDAVGDLGVRSLGDAIRPRQVQVKLIGRDVVWDVLL